ncbi:MAG TPA: exodeoxyribonuclease I [Gammaproteobacteria bacterium]|nr:exodeoxyribonuclease I [Gammaproteobacteria bacterium]
MSADSIYWHDYETFGADPRRDRPAQFAGIRTDLDLNIIGEPLVLYCRPANDFLPQPDACLITGITPQLALREGLPEAEFIARIHEAFSRPRTCVAGYNNIRFDDEVTRNVLYRNFFDPYAREWQNGNSRWDIIDLVRVAHALRPEGIEWPRHADGKPSFRLEDLTRANQLSHQSAHDALSDVYATIAIARLIRDRQPRLYDYVFRHRSKQRVASLLNVAKMTPVLHVSSMYPADLGCIALVAPLANHPTNRNEVVVYDLRHDPSAFVQLSVDELRQRLFTRQAELPEGTERLPVKTIHVNKCPVVVPQNTLTTEAAEKWRIDVDACRRHRKTLRDNPQFITALLSVYEQREFEPESDPDLMLYSGGFFSDEDRQKMEKIRHASPQRLKALELPFQDRRISEMLFRYRARNYPETLSENEVARWNEYRRQRLTDPAFNASIVDREYRARIDELLNSAEITEQQRDILDALLEYRQWVLNG